jgi:hypothetical protein
VVTTLTGSALLAIALLRGALDQDQVWTAAHVDEDWNIEKWGIDEEVAARRAARLVDLAAAGLLGVEPGRRQRGRFIRSHANLKLRPTRRSSAHADPCSGR